MLSAVLITLATNIITRLVKKLNIDGTFVAMGLALIGGTIYYVATNYYAVEREQLVKFAVGVYGASQLVYGLVIKQLPKK